MNTINLLFLALLMIFTSAVLAQSEPSLEESYSTTTEQIELDIAREYLDIMNAFRKKIGLGNVYLDHEMSKVAKRHSKNMALGKTEFGHVGFGRRCSMTKSIMGKANLCGEIVARGHKNSLRVFRGWMNSPGHRAKIVEDRYNYTGFGIYKDKSGRIYWTQVFLEVK